MYDLIIVGAGPAGLAAAIYAARAELKFIVLEKEIMSGGQIINTYEVDNYPGLYHMGGFDLAMKFREHADALGASFVTGEVDKIEEIFGGKKVICKDGTEYETKFSSVKIVMSKSGRSLFNLNVGESVCEAAI